jgi:hypothetical protein
MNLHCILLTHRQPALSARKPPAMGPITGPISGPILNIAMAAALLSIGNISPITPPPIVKQPDPPTPAKKRNTMRAGNVGANAHPI